MIWSRDRWNMLSRNAGSIDACARAPARSLWRCRAFGDGPTGQAPPKRRQAQADNPAPVAQDAAPRAAAAGPAVARRPRRSARPPADDAWVKLCMKSEQTQNKEICLINHEGLEPNTGMVLIAAAVRKVEGEEKQQLLVRVPTAYALVIPAGVQIKIDEEQPIQLQYTLCFPTSCQVQTRADQGNVRHHAQGQADGRRRHEHPAEDDGLSRAADGLRQGL